MPWAMSLHPVDNKLFIRPKHNICVFHDSSGFIRFDTLICLSRELWNIKLKINIEIYFLKSRDILSDHRPLLDRRERGRWGGDGQRVGHDRQRQGREKGKVWEEDRRREREGEEERTKAGWLLRLWRGEGFCRFEAGRSKEGGIIFGKSNPGANPINIIKSNFYAMLFFKHLDWLLNFFSTNQNA